MKLVVFVLIVNALLAWNVSGDESRKCCIIFSWPEQWVSNVKITDQREKRSPYNYDDEYNKFLNRNFHDVGGKHLDKKAEYKQVQKSDDGDDESGKAAESDGDDDGEGDGKNAEDYGVDHDWYYKGKNDYERIKALSVKQVEELQQKPGNCKHYEKDGMYCATCEDPETGDNSESCSYSSAPKDKKVAYLSKKSHNYKKPQAVEVEEPEANEDEGEEQEEHAFITPSGPKPLKHLSESDDADYGAYKLAGTNDDVEDYDEPKFAHLKAEPNDSKLINDFEIIPQKQFQSKNLNQAFTDFKTKDWSSCNKIMKGEMTCYYCKDHKNAVQEECMFVSASNPKNYKVEHHETFDNSKKPTATTKKPITPTKKPAVKFEAIRVAPESDDKKVRFARLRVGRPLMPTKPSVKSTAEPLVTPTTNLNPNNHDDFQNTESKRTIKRTISFQKKFSDDDFYPAESRAIRFESHVQHID